MKLKSLTGLTKEELKTLINELDEPSYRAEQLHHWLYIKSCSEFNQMINVSKSLKNKLSQFYQISSTQIIQKQVSSDGTIKYLLGFPDNQKVETVLMRFDNRPNLTACISTQIGCPINCAFCATAKQGFIRNLTTSEIIDQVLTIQRDTGLQISNIVFMGQGEPLLNYENLYNAIKLLNQSMNIGTRRITVSTSGYIPNILRLAEDFPQLTLAISLHASDPSLRKKLVPIEKQYPLNNLLLTLSEYYNKTHRRITIEYVIIKDINDNLNEAKELANLLKDLHCNINLIPYNNIDETSEIKFEEPEPQQVKMFKYILELSGKKVTIRLKRGNDISAACGQLSGKYKNG